MSSSLSFSTTTAIGGGSTVVADSTTDQWKKTSKEFSAQWTQFKLTSLYADDLITLLYDEISRPNLTILDIGCGTGIFAHAYLRAFPQGITGHTIISSDISPSMIEQAQESIEASLLSTTKGSNNNEATSSCQPFATKFLFQLEDGTQLQGISDHSIDIVVSLYGVFLIPDQVRTLQSIRRVLKPKTGIFANAAWTKQDQIDTSFGGNLQDSFMGLNHMVQQMKSTTTTANAVDSTGSTDGSSSTTTVPPTPPAFLQWYDPNTIATKLSQQDFVNIRTYRLFHSMISRNFHLLLNMCLENPMMQATNLTEEQLHTLKYAFFELCQIPYRSKEEQDQIIMNHNYPNNKDENSSTSNGASTNVPFTLWTASNLSISHVE